MVATSMPSRLSQACIACPVSASGSPEAKPSISTAASRHSRQPGPAGAKTGRTGGFGVGADAVMHRF
ncbi:hypothetical protein QMTAC487_12910 [Sphaerotilus sp. FB-3]|nr:hypothetical protein CQA4T8M7_03640 [Sphaerotilus natans]GKQ57432.1 hypothetical protein QMTAC487_12910 [Sphaerotilus sp. FB-3]